MSVELNVYARGPALSRETLIRESASTDLPEELRWNVVFLNSADSSRPDEDQRGDVSTDQLVAGWPSELNDSPKIQAALARGDRKKLDRLFQVEAYGVVSLSLVRPTDDDWRALTEPDFLRSVPAEHIAAVKDADAWYRVETSARRNQRSADLQRFLFAMIAALTFGITEDPQTGEFEGPEE